MSSDQWTLCPECHYPMLELAGFEGVSSSDAPSLGGKDAHDYWTWGGWAIVSDVLETLWDGLRLWQRKRKVKQLQQEVLPQFPKTLICPQCLHLVTKR